MKNLLVILVSLSTLFFQSCGESNPDPQNPVEIKSRTDQKVTTGGRPRDDFAANSVPVDDAVGRAKWSLGRVQEELTASAGQVKGLGKSTVLLDDNMLMVIKNEVDGDVYEKRVNLANLDADVKHMKFIVDNDPDRPNPGVQIPVLEGKAPVEIFKNGSKKDSKKYLEILLGERGQVQLVVSAMAHAIKVSQGDLSI